MSLPADAAIAEDAVPDSAAPPAETVEPTDTSDNPATVPALPIDITGWRALILTLPAKELLRLITKDKGATARLFAGFRAGPDTIRRAIVVQRMAEAAVKEAKFAAALASLIPADSVETASLEDVSAIEALEDAAPKLPTPIKEISLSAPAETPAPDDSREDPRLREKLKEQRAALRDKDARITTLEASLVATQRERDAARQEGDTARAAAKAANEETERIRHKRERDERRDAAQAAQAVARAAEAAANPKVSAAAASAAPVALATSRMVEEALQRLLTRGRYTVAAEVCREALAAEGSAGATSAERGRIHALYAASLYGGGSPAEGDEQDRLAAGHLLDAGELVRAAQSLGRILAQSPTAKPIGLTPTFKRLSALAEKMGQTDAVGDVLTHVRISSPEASRRLTAALSGAEVVGRQRSSLLRPHIAKIVTVGPDESIALPTANPRTATVTARAIVAAVDHGDAAYVADVRTALRAMQAREGHDRSVANALLETIAGLDTTAALPLAQTANQPIVVDASNVARHNPDPLALTSVPQVTQLIRMRDYLLGRGFFPVLLIADANLRFHVNDRSGYEALVARGVVHETPPGTSADEALIAEAHAYFAPLVTNDRMADWNGRANGIERLNFALLATGASLTPV